MCALHFIGIVIIPRETLELPLSLPDILFPLFGSQSLKINAGPSS